MTERTKTYVGWALIVGILLVAFSAVSYVRTYSKTIEPGAFRSFSVTGQGKAVAVLDVAQFSFTVITEGGNDIATLQQQNADKVGRAVAVVKERGVDNEDIRTEGYFLTPRYQNIYCGPESRVCPPANIVGYSISQTTMIKVRAGEFDEVGALLSGVIGAGANSVSQLQFTADDPVAVEAEARAEAIAQAKAKARAIADAGDFRLGRLLSIQEGGYPMPYAYGMGGAEMRDMAVNASLPPVPVEPGSQEVQIAVTLVYEIE